MSHRLSAYRTKQIIPAILIIDVQFPFILCLFAAGKIFQSDVLENIASISLSALWADFAVALAVGDVNPSTAEEMQNNLLVERNAKCVNTNSR